MTTGKSAPIYPTPSSEQVVALEVDGKVTVITDDDQLATELRRRFARRPRLSADTLEAIAEANAYPTRPVVLYVGDGTEIRSTL